MLTTSQMGKEELELRGQQKQFNYTLVISSVIIHAVEKCYRARKQWGHKWNFPKGLCQRLWPSCCLTPKMPNRQSLSLHSTSNISHYMYCNVLGVVWKCSSILIKDYSDSMRYACRIHAESMENPCGIHAEPMRNQYVIHGESIWNLYCVQILKSSLFMIK